MKINKKSLLSQRELTEKKLKKWLPLRSDKRPPSGWVKAIRGALGLSTYQMGRLMGVNQATVTRLEQRERQGGATIEAIQKAAQAMNCKLIYAIVPNDEYRNLDAILNEKAEHLALKTLQRVDHSMSLENQGSGTSKTEVQKLAKELKNAIDPRMWSQDGEGS
jgi:predicted DNA-binding mobile mystery protein A